MKKFLQYLTFSDFNNEYLFPSPIGHIVFVIVFVVCIGTCSRKTQDEVKHVDLSIEVDTTSYAAEEVKLDSIDAEFSIPKGKYWSSEETKLPRGIVQATDYAHGSKGKGDDQTNNYVTVKGTDGKLTIVRDVEIDLFLNLQNGDTIK